MSGTWSPATRAPASRPGSHRPGTKQDRDQGSTYCRRRSRRRTRSRLVSATAHRQARPTYTHRNQTRPGVTHADMNDHDETAEIVIDSVTGT